MCQFCKIEISSQCDYRGCERGWVMWIWCAGIVASLYGADFISLPGLPGQFCSVHTEWGWGWCTQLRSCATNSELLQGTGGRGCRMINVPNQRVHTRFNLLSSAFLNLVGWRNSGFLNRRFCLGFTFRRFSHLYSSWGVQRYLTLTTPFLWGSNIAI